MDISKALRVIEAALNGESYIAYELGKALEALRSKVKQGFKFTVTKLTTGKLRGIEPK